MRSISGRVPAGPIRADGITFVLRDDGDRCYYAEEDVIAPLWKGRPTKLAWRQPIFRDAWKPRVRL